MAQWGETRIFLGEDGSRIAAICEVYTVAFAPIEADSKIHSVSRLSSQGDETEIAKLTAAAKSYIGKPYTEWVKDLRRAEEISTLRALRARYPDE